MSVTEPTPPQQPAMSDKQLVLIVYILYFAAYITGITALIGVIIAHVQVGPPTRSSPRITAFRSATFWIGLLYLVVGSILTLA